MCLYLTSWLTALGYVFVSDHLIDCPWLCVCIWPPDWLPLAMCLYLTSWLTALGYVFVSDLLIDCPWYVFVTDCLIGWPWLCVCVDWLTLAMCLCWLAALGYGFVLTSWPWLCVCVDWLTLAMCFCIRVMAYRWVGLVRGSSRYGTVHIRAHCQTQNDLHAKSSHQSIHETFWKTHVSH